MGAVLGLSLTSDDVVWILVDPIDRSVLDHDAFDLPDDAEITGTAAQGAQAIAAAAGLEVDRVRLTWSDTARHEGLRLLTRLRCLKFENVDAVPLKSVLAVSVNAAHEDMAPRLALAYGAALAEVTISEPITEPVSRQVPMLRGFQRPLVYAAVGLTAAAGVGVLFLTTGSAPRVEPAATTAGQLAPPDPGWVTVTAPADATAEANRKVVAVPPDAAEMPVAEAPAAVPAPVYSPPPAVEVADPEPAAALSSPEPVEALPEPASSLPEPASSLPEPAEALPAPAEALAAPAPAEALPAPAEALPAPEPVAALPVEQPIGEPHLPEVAHLPAVQPAIGPVSEVPGPPPAPGPEMTEPLNVFTAVP